MIERWVDIVVLLFLKSVNKVFRNEIKGLMFIVCFFLKLMVVDLSVKYILGNNGVDF